MMHSWDRRYFVIQGSLLLYYTRGKVQTVVSIGEARESVPLTLTALAVRASWHERVQEDDDAVVATNLRLCNVKVLNPPEIDRRFCFQMVSPTRTYILQGMSDDDVAQWVTILQAAIASSLTSPDATDEASDVGLGGGKKERLSKEAIAAIAMQRAAQRAAKLRLERSPSSAAVLSHSSAPGSGPASLPTSPPLSQFAALHAAAAGEMSATSASLGSLAEFPTPTTDAVAAAAAAAATGTSPALPPAAAAAPAQDAPLTHEQVQAIRSLPGNFTCADCGSNRACSTAQRKGGCMPALRTRFRPNEA